MNHSTRVPYFFAFIRNYDERCKLEQLEGILKSGRLRPRRPPRGNQGPSPTPTLLFQVLPPWRLWFVSMR